jgi:hypothetical protein
MAVEIKVLDGGNSSVLSVITGGIISHTVTHLVGDIGNNILVLLGKFKEFLNHNLEVDEQMAVRFIGTIYFTRPTKIK